MGAGKGFNAQLDGMEGVKRKLAAVSRTVRGKVVRKAMGKTVRPLVKLAKARVQVDTGWLKKSLGDKVSTTRGKGVTVGIVGPRYGFKGSKKKGTRKLTAFGKRLVANTWKRPTRYAHLVELGTYRTRAYPFIQTAWRAGKGQAENTLISEIKAGLLQAARTA